ncbi:transposable element Tcb2 transposase [Trichonephila clavipes]|nr:transposable element Tcb2 transposase [Trichonephila clavipes]
MRAQRYVLDFLQPHMLPLIQRLPGPIFQQDNALPHTARVLQDCLHTVSFLPWNARSPNLSQIEHIWSHLVYLVVKVSDRVWHVTISSPEPLKTRCVGGRCTANQSRAQTYSCGVVARRMGSQIRFRPCHLTVVKNYEVRHPKP